MSFSETLCSQRKAAGYASAWALYKAHGPRYLGCTYKAYLHVESGRSLPQPKLAMRIASAVNAFENPERSRAFVKSYLETLVGKKELVDFLLRNLASSPQSPGRPSVIERASKISFAGKQVAITKPQADALISSWEGYWCWLMLSDDSGRKSASELAAHLGVAQPKVKAALKNMARQGLIEEDAQGRFSCPQAGSMFNFPRDSWHLPAARQKLKEIWARAAEKKGGLLLRRSFLTRASEADVRGYLPRLVQLAAGARIYSVWDKGPDTAFVSIQTTVKKVMPF